MSLIDRAEAEIGYLEKSRAAYNKYGDACLMPKKEFAGNDNLTKYALTAKHQNGQPWCQTFIAALLIDEWGRDIANKLLCGMISSPSTMDVKNAMVKAGRSVPLNEAKSMDIVYRSRNGGGHVGLVVGWQNGGLVTIEGNSSSADINSWNGGAVVKHVGATWMWCCRPDYSIVDTWHWLKVDGIWYYQDSEGRNSYGWRDIKETTSDNVHRYFFNKKGQMLTGSQTIEGSLYCFMPSGDLEGALCKSDSNGVQSVWYL